MKSNKNFLIVLVPFLVSLSLPLGAYEKIKDYLSITTGAVETRILNGDLDPSESSGVAAPIGSEYLRDDGDSFKKVGSADTEWIRQVNTSTPVGLELMEDPSFEKSVSSYCVSDNTAPFLTSNTLLRSPNNKKGTRINLKESGVTNYTCTIPVSAAYEGTPIRHKGWLTLWSAGNFSCSIVAQWNGADVGNAQIITSSQNIYYDLEVVPTGAGTTGFKLSCNNATADTTYFVIHDETSNKAERLSPVLANIGNVTDWQSFTPTGSWTTNTTYSGRWRRVGDTAEVEYSWATSGAPNSTSLSINLPAGLKIDYTKELSGSTTGQSLVSFFNATTIFGGSYYAGSSDAVAIRAWRSDVTFQSHADVNQNTPFTWGAGSSGFAKIQVPILGWSATSPTIVMQNETFNSDINLGAWVAQPNTGTCSSAVIEGEANVGKWTTCSQITANNLDVTGCTTRPTQSDADAKSQGLLIHTRNYATARPCTAPTEVFVNIGKGLATNDPLRVYKNASMNDVENKSSFYYNGSNIQAGLVGRSYNPHTGILHMSGNVILTTITTGVFTYDSGNESMGYARINASKNPAMSGVNAPARYIVKTYKSGTNWYEVNNDCWVRQGGYISKTTGSENAETLHLTMSDNLYHGLVGLNNVTYSGTFGAATVSMNNKTTTTFTVRGDPNQASKSWIVEGYGSKTALQALGVDTSKCQ